VTRTPARGIPAPFHALGDVTGVGDCLEGLAHVAARRGDDRRAVVLWAVGESIRIGVGARADPAEAEVHEDDLAAARIRLGEAGVAGAWVEGAALSVEDAVAFALGSPATVSGSSSGNAVSSTEAAG
jgi:hypothetical protein